MKQSTKNITLAASALRLLHCFRSAGPSKAASRCRSRARKHGSAARLLQSALPVSRAGNTGALQSGTAAVVGAGAAYYGGAGYYGGSPYYSGTVRGARAAYVGDNIASGPITTRPHFAVGAYYAGGPWYGYTGWPDYAARNAISCRPVPWSSLMTA